MPSSRGAGSDIGPRSAESLIGSISRYRLRRMAGRPWATAGAVSVWIFRVVVFLEMLDGALDLNPVMFRLLENRYDGGGVFRICHRADCNTDHRRQAGDFPIDR